MAADRAPTRARSTRRVRRLTPSEASDIAAALSVLAGVAAGFVVTGEVAGALQGWPLDLGGGVIEVCPAPGCDAPLAAALGPRPADRDAGRVRDVRLRVVESPPGTRGFADLSRTCTPITLPAGSLRVAGLLDLPRIADASTHRSAPLEALAVQAVLDVERAQSRSPTTERRSDDEAIAAWLEQQTPVSA